MTVKAVREFDSLAFCLGEKMFSVSTDRASVGEQDRASDDGMPVRENKYDEFIVLLNHWKILRRQITILENKLNQANDRWMTWI